MRLHFNLVLLGLVALLTATACCAQDTQELSKGRLTTTDARLVRFASARLDATTLSYEPGHGDASQQMPLDQVLRVEVEHGNNGAKFALMGGLSGLAGALLGVNTTSSDVEVSSSTKTTIVAAMTGLCVVIGYAVGAGQKVYETTYENPAFKSLREDSQSLRLAPPGTVVSWVAHRF